MFKIICSVSCCKTKQFKLITKPPNVAGLEEVVNLNEKKVTAVYYGLFRTSVQVAKYGCHKKGYKNSLSFGFYHLFNDFMLDIGVGDRDGQGDTSPP